MRKIVEKYGHILILCMITGLISLYSPLNPFLSKSITTDQAVFFTIAEGLLDGKLAYVDFFDHKGPLLYFILALGLAFGKSMIGNFVIELAFIFTTVFFIYKIAHLFAPKWISALVPAVIFCSDITQFTTANSEEYILPLICIAVYLFLLQIKNGINNKQVFIIGFLGMLVFFIKFNYCLIWAGIGIILFLRMCFKKDKLIDVVKMCCSFFVGMLIATIPFLIYLFATGSFDEFIDAYVVFSFSYAGYNDFLYKIQCAIILLNTPLFVFLISSILLYAVHKVYYCIKKKSFIPDISNEQFNLCGYFFLIVIIVMIVVGSPGQVWGYYKHATMIMYAVPIAIVSAMIYSLLNKKLPYVVSGLFVIVLMIGVIHSKLTRDYYQISEDGRYESTMNICEIIEEQCDEDDTMISFACDCSMYFYSDCEPASRVIFPSASIVRPSLTDEIMADLEAKKPKIITFTSDWTWGMTDRMEEEAVRFTEENYSLFYEDEYRKVYLRNNE